MPAVLPSGTQYELALGDQVAVAVELGAGLRRYAVGGRDVLDGYAADEPCSSGRGQQLIPWPNRIRHGRYGWLGRRHHLALSEPKLQNAIHGLVRWSNWTAVEREPHRVALEHVLHPQPGYPFALALRIEYALSDAGLSVRTSATNVGSEPCPYGAGAHPYLAAGPGTVDATLLRVPAGTVLESDEFSIPVGSASVDGTELDFRVARRIGATRLDHCFTGLERGEDGLARVELGHPDGGARVTLWADSAYPYLMLFTGDPLPDVARRSLAVEPMTCPPNAFRSGESLVCLEPGEMHSGTWGVDPRP